MGYLFSGEKNIKIKEQEFESVTELINHVLLLKKQSPEKFEEFTKTLINQDNQLMPMFEAWLIANGKQAVLNNWKETLKP